MFIYLFTFFNPYTIFGFNYRRLLCYLRFSIHSFASFQAPPISVVFLSSYGKVYHKQEVCLLLYLLGQIVTWQYNPYLLELKLTMYCYKWSWLTVAELSMVRERVNVHFFLFLLQNMLWKSEVCYSLKLG